MRLVLGNINEEDDPDDDETADVVFAIVHQKTVPVIVQTLLFCVDKSIDEIDWCLQQLKSQASLQPFSIPDNGTPSYIILMS